MNTIPNIAQEQAEIAFSGAVVPLELLKIYNERIDKANAEQSAEQYITAAQAREFGAGNAEYLDEDYEWRVCSSLCKYRDCHQYRALK